MKTKINALVSGLVIATSLMAQGQTSELADFFGSGLAGEVYATAATPQAFKFVKNGQRFCKASGGFFVKKCLNKEIGRKADSMNTQMGDYCDAMVTDTSVVYKLPDFYNTDAGANYLTVANGQDCRIVNKTASEPVKPRQSSFINKKDLINAAILGKSADEQHAQIVVKVSQEARWVMLYQSEIGLPVVELRDSKNVRVVVDRYLLAKGNGKPYESVVGFRTLNCEKMAAENHDTRDQIQTKNFNETCIQVVGVNANDALVSLAIIPSSKLKNHLFRSVQVGWNDYTVEEEFSQEDILLAILTALFGN
jgi:hypothetical protein